MKNAHLFLFRQGLNFEAEERSNIHLRVAQLSVAHIRRTGNVSGRKNRKGWQGKLLKLRGNWRKKRLVKEQHLKLLGTRSIR